MRADDDYDSLLDFDELATLLERHEGPGRARPRPEPRPALPGGGVARRSPRPPRRLRLRLGVVVAAAALLAGSGLGFGLASSLTPAGNAVTPFAGFGFLPARGWTVVQSGTMDATGSATAIAANVPLAPEDGMRALPERTLAALPERGVVISVTFTTRGDPGEDFRYPARTLPLDLAAATPVPPSSTALASPGGSEYRLRAGVRGHNLDARIYFGTALPSAQAVAAAERQLERLVVAAERVTIFARPTVVGRPWVTTLFGSVDGRRAGELVNIQAKDCGTQFFRGVTGTTTREGGQWTTEYTPGISTTLRAVWSGHASAPVVVRVQAPLNLRRSLGGYEVGIAARAQFWRRHVLIQQRRQGRWRPVRQVLLTQSGGPAGAGYVYTFGRFRLSLPRGTQIRAVLPASQARPCYLAGTSIVLRT